MFLPGTLLIILSLSFLLMLSMEHTQKKKPSMEKFTEDVRRVWEHYLIYVDAIPK